MHNIATSIEASFPEIAWALFAMGFAGSFIHCAFMCGPFVVMQSCKHLETVSAKDMSEVSRIKGAILLPYHLGRVTTYMLLGGIVAILGGGANYIWKDFTTYLLLLTGILMILSVTPYFKHKFSSLGRVSLTSSKNNYLGKLAGPLLNSPFGWRGYFLGVVLGFLPCGMLYAALAMASATGSFMQGAIVMGLFVVGTVPALIIASYLGTYVTNILKNKMTLLRQGFTVMAGAWLCFIAIS